MATGEVSGAAGVDGEGAAGAGRIAILGDSISTFAGYSEDSAGGTACLREYYPSGDVTDVSRTWWDIVRRGMGDGCVATVSAISGSGYWLDDGPLMPPGYTDARIARLGEGGEPDYIFVNLGTNDRKAPEESLGERPGARDVDALEGAKATVAGACALTIAKLRRAYPRSRIVVLVPKWNYHTDTDKGRRAKARYARLCDLIAEVAGDMGVYRVIDLRDCGIDFASVRAYTFDGIHPNAEGMALMGAYVLRELGLTRGDA